MKLEVGMNVRYKRISMGYNIALVDKIGKIINQINKSDIYELDNNNNIFENDAIKASYNIIDILEVGDYVNGYPIYEIVEYEDDTRAIVIGDDNKSIIWKKQDIEDVITKEQFEQMKYRIGE